MGFGRVCFLFFGGRGIAMVVTSGYLMYRVWMVVYGFGCVFVMAVNINGVLTNHGYLSYVFWSLVLGSRE